MEHTAIFLKAAEVDAAQLLSISLRTPCRYVEVNLHLGDFLAAGTSLGLVVYILATIA
jgi:hypothetical protein